MSNAARGDVVSALRRLAQSADYQDRADAGRALAGFAERPEAWDPLQALLLDADNTFVTRVTAEALLRRHDAVGLAAVASALAGADFNHMSWIHTAVYDVFGIFARERDAALRITETLVRDHGRHLEHGADQLREALAKINPVLHPVDEAGSDEAGSDEAGS
ncbi:hypothetical protein [Actinoplanes rectilineatus]|uniref:hypothetical protein n=1 Tax=Actinoplanes rectilineatus TaxID=113571 RepID=UPI0006979E50|nr:hypothetical protein [Actinoplanes rectilineatus]